LYLLSNSVVSTFSEKQANLSSKLPSLSSNSITTAVNISRLFSSIQATNAKIKTTLYILPDANRIQMRSLLKDNTEIMLLILSTFGVLFLLFLKWRKINLGRILQLACFVSFSY
jgi:hypothetical protein